MGIRSVLGKPLAAFLTANIRKWSRNPVATQERVFQQLISGAAPTVFGKEHGFRDIRDYDAFKKQVPVRDYEGLSPWIEQVKKGQPDVLWPGKPLYFAKTSGTTSGTKYIPISKASISTHINSARDALMCYVHETGNARFLDGKMIFLSGSPEMTETGGIPTGRLSGIVNHHVPAYLRSNQLPTYGVNCIDDWEEKLERIIDETLPARMTLISGIPPWVQMYFDRIAGRTGKTIREVFPDFSLFVHGGVNFEPYAQKLYDTIGRKIDTIETYPASEGFIAYQDSQQEEGLLLLLNNGIFYEFIPAGEYFSDNPARLRIDEVEVGKNYAIILNTNAGLWGYTIGDTVRFVSTDPYRVVVSGRIKHFISAFGEHVIGEEVEKAMQMALQQFSEARVVEFTVAPQVTPREGLPYHEWLVEFSSPPADRERFSDVVDQALRQLNTYYDDLIAGGILKRLQVTMVRQDGFREYMKSQGKLGGQNKVPRLANDRKVAEGIAPFVI